MISREFVTPSNLAEHFRYDPDSGRIHRIKPFYKAGIGLADEGVAHNGYRRIRFMHKDFSAHRVAWALYYRAWPTLDIDHKNGDRADNRLANLRLCTHAENLRNCKVQLGTKCGFKGVYKPKNGLRFYARIIVGGRRIELGGFDTKEEAAHRYNMAAEQHFAEFARLNEVAAIT